MEAKNCRSLLERDLKVCPFFLQVGQLILLSCFGCTLVILGRSYGRVVKKALYEEQKVSIDVVS